MYTTPIWVRNKNSGQLGIVIVFENLVEKILGKVKCFPAGMKIIKNEIKQIK